MSPEAAPRSRAHLWLMIGGALLLAVLVVVARRAPDHGLGALASIDPGAPTQIAAAIARFLLDVSATMTVGGLAYVVLCTVARPSPRFGPMVGSRGYRTLRSCSRWAALWALAAIANLVLAGAVDSDVSLSRLRSVATALRLVHSSVESSYWLVTAVGAAVIAVVARFATLWRNAAALLGLAVLTLLPPLFIGHASSDRGHDWSTGAITLHVPAAVIWIGLAIHLLREVRQEGAVRDGLLRRYAAVSAICWGVLVMSGLVLGRILDPHGSLGTVYGRVLVVKAVVVLGVGAALVLRRRRVVGAGVADARATLVRVLVGDLVLLGLALVLSVQLSTLAPPAFSAPVSIQQTLLGYDLGGRPTLVRLATAWRVEVLFLALAITLASWYVVLWRRVRRAGEAWPAGRVVAWIAGCALAVVATCSGLGRYEPAMFSIHMAGHMVLATFAPMLLALGGPLSLAAQAVRPAGGGLPGARDWLGIIEDSPLTRWLTHPVVALGLLVWSPFLIYFGGIFDHAARFHWAHMLLDLSFLLAGYLFAWTVVGVDQTPRPTPSLARLGILLAAMPFDALFSGLVLSTHRLLGDSLSAANMYSSLRLPWVHSLLADQRRGGVISLVIGEAAVVAAVVVLVVRWWRLDEPLFGLGLGLSRADGSQPQAVRHHEE